MHPELAMVGRSTVAIGRPAAGSDEPIYDRMTTISLLHVMQFEPLDRQAPEIKRMAQVTRLWLSL